MRPMRGPLAIVVAVTNIVSRPGVMVSSNAASENAMVAATMR